MSARYVVGPQCDKHPTLNGKRYKQNDRKGGQCVQCVKDKGRANYANSPKKYVRSIVGTQSVTTFIHRIKSVTPCADCGQIFHPCQMDFDHRDPKTKERVVSGCGSAASVLAEIEKCDLVCANCHRMRTWKRQTHQLRLALL